MSGTIETVFKAHDDLWPVFADAAQTEASLMNLALNASDVMVKSGTLKITATNVRVAKTKSPHPLNLKAGDYVKISVTDTGPGMTPDGMEKAFEPFFTTKEVGEDSGLGLSVVMGFSKQSSGDTHIESSIGIGTTISIYLPRAQEVQRAEAPLIAEAPKKWNGEHIHILDNNSQVVSAVTRMASSLGYAAKSSTTVDLALEAAHQDRSIALFLIDVVLPGGRSGVDFALEVLKTRPDAKLTLMSGFPDGDLVRDITQSFHFGFLPKPFSRAQLADALTEALGS